MIDNAKGFNQKNKDNAKGWLNKQNEIGKKSRRFVKDSLKPIQQSMQP